MTKYVYLTSGEILSHEEWREHREHQDMLRTELFERGCRAIDKARERITAARQQEHSVLSPE